VIEDRLHQRKIARSQVFKIANGDLRRGNILFPVGAENFAGQMKQPAALLLVAPEAPCGKQKIEVRKATDRQVLPAENEARLEKRKVESLPVKCDHRAKIHLGEETAEILDHLLLSRQVPEKKLSDVELVFPVKTKSDKKGNDACAPRQTGRFEVQEERGGEVPVRKLLVPAEGPEDIAFDLEAGVKSGLSVSRLEEVLIFENLDGGPWLGLGKVLFFPGRFFVPGETDQPFEFLFSREVGVFVNLLPRFVDRVRS
jgi:hypothetical protein